MDSIEAFLKKYSAQVRFMTIYYLVCLLVSLIICYFYYVFDNNDKEKIIAEQVAACPYTTFHLSDENKVVCCKTAFITHCGLTAAFCEGKIPMFLCEAHSSCLSGPLCATLPNWIKDNASEL